MPLESTSRPWVLKELAAQILWRILRLPEACISQGINVLYIEVHDRLSHVVAGEDEGGRVGPPRESKKEIVDIPCATACNCSG
jgi:hypothetical protein